MAARLDVAQTFQDWQRADRLIGSSELAQGIVKRGAYAGRGQLERGEAAQSGGHLAGQHAAQARLLHYGAHLSACHACLELTDDLEHEVGRSREGPRHAQAQPDALLEHGAVDLLRDLAQRHATAPGRRKIHNCSHEAAEILGSRATALHEAAREDETPRAVEVLEQVGAFERCGWCDGFEIGDGVLDALHFGA